MSSLVHILSEFRAGRLNQPQLFARVESLLNADGDNLDDLQSELQQEHAMTPLPLATFVGLRKHLVAAAAPKTEILTEAPPMPAPAQPTDAPSKEEVTAKQAIGATLAGRFKLVEYIGSGGTSRLYKALDQRKVEAGAEDTHVAVKVLTLPIKDTLEALAVLHRETEGLQQLAHPNIVRVIDCDRDGDLVFMTMEFIRGRTLHSLMRSSRFLGAGRSDVWPIVNGIADAVDFAHSRFIVHGDLTPGNVMVTPANMPKVIDFGIARIFGQPLGKPNGTGSVRRSNSRGEIAGFSPAYASPEMLEFKDPDPRDDIYSLACIVWELLTGAHPFGRANAKVAREECRLLKYTDKLTRTEFNALSRALTFDREKRTPTVKQFIAELTAAKSKPLAKYATAASLVMLAAALTYAYLSRAPRSNVAAPAAQVAVTTPPPAVQESAPKIVSVPELHTVEAKAGESPAPGALFRDCPTCPLLTVLPTGEFLQGSHPNSVNALAFEMPQHRVTIGRAFAASKTEITVGEYSEFATATGREAKGCSTYDGAWKPRADLAWKNAVAQQTALHAVSCVSWQDAQDYVHWLSARSGKTYRLPSASEWEFAARAGSTADTAWNSDAEACGFGNLADQAGARRFPGWTVHNCNDAFVQTAPVGSFAANNFGLQDMLGNVFEWVADCWNETYAGAPADGSARQDGDCSQHEMRGGSWFTSPAFMRFAYRNRFASDYRSTSVGFRVVREIAQ